MVWFKNSKGKPDAMLTFAILAFAISALKFLASGLVLELVAGKTVNLGTVDAASIAALLTPTLGAYVARRHSDQKYPLPEPPKDS
jgi:hypothetical protein